VTKHIRAIIFDFDGTIIDSESPEFETWRETFLQHGQNLSVETWSRYIGTHGQFDVYAHFEQLTGQRIDRDEMRERIYSKAHAAIRAQPLLPGVLETIHAARRLGLKLAVASTSSCAWVEGHLERLGLTQYFPVIRCREWVQRVKPEPDLYLAALEALGVQPAEAIALEDSPNGVLAANRAGVFSVAIPNVLTMHYDLSHANLIINSLVDQSLEELIAAVERRRAVN